MNKKFKIIIFSLLALIVLTLIAGYFKHTNIPVLEPKGTIGEQERNLIIFALGLSLIVVLPVYALLFAFAWRYRESNHKKAKYSPELGGNWLAETVWWLIPGVLIAILSVVAWNSSHQLDPFKPIASTASPLTIQVVALDWKWLFIYPEQRIAAVNYVQFPADTPVNFQITADAPMNSFWIPQLGGQIYAMPGMSTQLHLMADRQGSFHGSSANISGQGFAGMTFTAKSSSMSDFRAWVKSAQHSPSRLSMQAYNKLARPSQDNPVAYYSAPQSNLYNQVIMKYVLPSDSHGVLPLPQYMGGH